MSPKPLHLHLRGKAARGNPSSGDGERFLIGRQPTVIDSSEDVTSVEDAAHVSRQWAAGRQHLGRVRGRALTGADAVT
jgi:hypothetical protein